MIITVVVKLQMPVITHPFPPQPIHRVDEIIRPQRNDTPIPRDKSRHPTKIELTIVSTKQQGRRTCHLLTERPNPETIPVDDPHHQPVAPDHIEVLEIPVSPAERTLRYVPGRAQRLVLVQQDLAALQKLCDR